MFGRDARVVDIAACTGMGIPVYSSPYGHSHSAGTRRPSSFLFLMTCAASFLLAEFVISQIVLLSRKIGDRNLEMQAGNWQKVSNDCHEVRGKTLGIVGYGHVGSQLGVLAEFMGMRVIWYDRLPLMPIGNSEPVDTLPGLLAQADYVTLAVTDAPDNTRLFKAEEFSQMKKGAIFIHTSYSEAVDLDALADAIDSGHLAGAAVDSFPLSERPTNGHVTKHRLASCPNVILTPGISGKTLDAATRVGAEVAHCVARFIEEGCTQGALNFPVIETKPLRPNVRRILNVHKSVRGVVTEINNILAEYNIERQTMVTKDGIGYVTIDVNIKEVTVDIVTSLALLANSIRTRCL
mgnify:CR=1 FL=1